MDQVRRTAVTVVDTLPSSVSFVSVSNARVR